ncbi:DUF3180 domain-containing protein [Ornithinicoccus halotolerans]|uniref:DUF3180 domain-containing protein n=1 Tax=Ornithinicoccus halotolerans TaxID=1748220 RepID=UPI0012980527|nr:DUF3180 domain-containing protein [Ornithinicoccus halotolerans]
MSRPGEVRPGVVALLALASGVGCWILLDLWRRWGNELPQLPWVGVIPLSVLVLAVLVGGWQVRRYLAGEGRGRPSPQRARGTLVAAQASALGGGALLGWYLANVLVHLPNADVPSVREALWRALVSAGVALALALVGLLVQHWCRLPPTEDDEDDDDDGGRSRDLAYG